MSFVNLMDNDLQLKIFEKGYDGIGGSVVEFSPAGDPGLIFG